MIIFLKIKIIPVWLICMVLGFIDPVLSQKTGYDARHIYHPEGNDFVIENGGLAFNRALYGMHSAFRIQAGDLPKWALYLPGMGGMFQFGIKSGAKSKWLQNASFVQSRYHEGLMVYEISDSLLGKDTLKIILGASSKSETMLVQVYLHGPISQAYVELFWIYGGACRKKFLRNGDIGVSDLTEYELRPSYCSNNYFLLKDSSFRLGDRGNSQAYLYGKYPASSNVKLLSFRIDEQPISLWNNAADTALVMCGRLIVLPHKAYYWSISKDSLKDEDESQFKQMVEAKKALASRINIETPDVYVNPVMQALLIASDAIWQAPSYLHGAVGWRRAYNGWRGAYVADPLGWHDRAKRHFESYFSSQYTEPATEDVIPDTACNLSRQKEVAGSSLFSCGYISEKPGVLSSPHHYDMNLVYVDALFRHFSWVADTEMMKEAYPVIVRHLEWEKRNFSRWGDYLFDSYADIWSSDALYYQGGAVTHSSAYNYWENLAAGKLSALLHYKDSSFYQKEAFNIRKAVNATLWLPDLGVWAEYKDRTGLKLIHPSAALWTIYQAIDSHLADPFQAYLSLRYIDYSIPHIGIRETGLREQGEVLSTTNWMPYTWSLNNVAYAELFHTSLAYWLGSRPEVAFHIWKSAVLESMYLGKSPGNIAQTSASDIHAHYAYQDFADPIGVLGRSLIEGLFGIRPEVSKHLLFLCPGFPLGWNFAKIGLPDILFQYTHLPEQDIYLVKPRFQQSLSLQFRIRAKSDHPFILLNGKSCSYRVVKESVGSPLIEIMAPVDSSYLINIFWRGNTPDSLPVSYCLRGAKSSFCFKLPHAHITAIKDIQHLISRSYFQINRCCVVFNAKSNAYGSFFIQVRQGNLNWWLPVNIRFEDSIDIKPCGFYPKDSLTFFSHLKGLIHGRFFLNGTFLTSIAFDSSACGSSVFLNPMLLFPGTNIAEIRFPNGSSLKKQWTCWTYNKIRDTAFYAVAIEKFYNDSLTNIFRKRYWSPRPLVPTLQLPLQGIGTWSTPDFTVNINDQGLRRSVGANGYFSPGKGLFFKIAADQTGNNVVFVSRWNNFPQKIAIPLTGKASHVYMLMAGTTNPMQSRMVNGLIKICYKDGSSENLELRNPENWPSIEQMYEENGLAFHSSAGSLLRISLKTGKIVEKNNFNNPYIEGGAATIVDLPLNKDKQLSSISITCIANDILIGLLGITLSR